MHDKFLSSSSSDENVGVVSTLAVFALNAKVEKLTDENKLVKSKCDSFEKEVCKQKLIYLDLKYEYCITSEIILHSYEPTWVTHSSNPSNQILMLIAASLGPGPVFFTCV